MITAVTAAIPAGVLRLRKSTAPPATTPAVAPMAIAPVTAPVTASIVATIIATFWAFAFVPRRRTAARLPHFTRKRHRDHAFADNRVGRRFRDHRIDRTIA